MRRPCVLIIEIVAGIHRTAVLTDLKVQVEARGMSRTADLAEGLSLFDALADGYID